MDILLTSDLRADALVVPTVKTGLGALTIWSGCWGCFGGGTLGRDCSGADLGWVNCKPLELAFIVFDVEGASTSMMTGSLVMFLVTLTTAAESDVIRCCASIWAVTDLGLTG